MSVEQAASDPQTVVMRRNYIVACANRLATLCQGDRHGLRATLADIAWGDLARMPHWCLLDKSALAQLQVIAGVVYLYPAIRNIIDGEVLARIRLACGHEAFDAIRSAEISATSSAQLETDTAIEKQLMTCGAAVLLGTLPDKQLAAIFRPELGEAAGSVAPAAAAQVYLLAASIHNELAQVRTAH